MSDPKERPYGARKYSEILRETAKYVDDRRKGNIKSLLTPWPGLNKAGVNGIEWGSLVTIGARPGAGKTLIVSQILREARILNPGQDFNILEFQFAQWPGRGPRRSSHDPLGCGHGRGRSGQRPRWPWRGHH